MPRECFERATGASLARLDRAEGTVATRRAVAAALEEALEERPRVPVPVLISRALAAADLGATLAAPRAPARRRCPGPRKAPTWAGRPISVPPGRHFVTFRHPYSPDEQRTIKIAAGQSVMIDVSMRIERAGANAGARDGGEDVNLSP